MPITLGNGNITFGTNKTQSRYAGQPSYSSILNSRSQNTWYQASVNLYVTVHLLGPYRNGSGAYVGPNTSSYTYIADVGDDHNSNTKGEYIGFPIQQGSWYYISSGATMTGDNFEDVRIYEWPIVT